MALPGNILIEPFQFSTFEANDQLPRDPLTTDYEFGGINLNDVSAGLRVKSWKVYLNGSNVMISPYPYTTATVLFTGTGITELSLTFDQLMNPVVAFVQDGISKFRWYNASTLSYTVTTLPTDSISPFAYLDDKRKFASDLGLSDILIFFMVNNVLKYVQQRDNYSIVRTLHTFTGIYLKRINRVGMGRNLRMGIETVDTTILA